MFIPDSIPWREVGSALDSKQLVALPCDKDCLEKRAEMFHLEMMKYEGIVRGGFRMECENQWFLFSTDKLICCGRRPCSRTYLRWQ